MDLRRLWNRIASVVSLAVVDRRASSGTYQVLHAGEHASADVEHLQPQGLHFAAPSDAQGVLLSPGAVKEASVLLGVGGATPGDSLASGEGGLHFLGEWRVFLAADGAVHLGARNAGDAAALASVTQAALVQLQAAVAAALGAITSPGGGPAVVSAYNAAIAGFNPDVASQTVRIDQ